MKVLVACEYSGRVRDAFTAKGHDAISCDLLETEVPGKHYKGDIKDIIYDGFDLMIAHPPCTHLPVSVSRHFWCKVSHGCTYKKILPGKSCKCYKFKNQTIRSDNTTIYVWSW